MNGEKYFCTLDVHQTYLYMLVDKDFEILQAISTHLGWNQKLQTSPYKHKVAPNAWQRFMVYGCKKSPEIVDKTMTVHLDQERNFFKANTLVFFTILIWEQ